MAPGGDSILQRTAAALKAPITAIKSPPTVSRIGYHGSVRLKRVSRIGIINVGSACGLMPQRHFAGLIKTRQYAIVNNQCAEILGSLGIGSLALDLSGVRSLEGDLAEIDINPLYCTASIKRVFDRAGHITGQVSAQQHSRRTGRAGRSATGMLLVK
jgi:alanine racemase